MDLISKAKAWDRINELFLSTAKPPLSFWSLEGEYGYFGYPFYIALFGSSVPGMGVGGWCHLKR
jgi:hypothetical protein